MKKPAIRLLCVFIVLMLTAQVTIAEGTSSSYPPLHESVSKILDDSKIIESLHFPTASQYGMSGGDTTATIRMMGGTEDIYAQFINLLEENGVVVSQWKFLPDPDCGATYVTIENVRWGDVEELRSSIEEGLYVETSIYSFDADSEASEAVITFKADTYDEVNEAIRIVVPYYSKFSDNNITAPDSEDSSGNYTFRIPDITSKMLDSIRIQMSETANLEITESYIDTGNDGTYGTLTLCLFAMTRMDYESHMRAIEERAGFNYYMQYAYEPIEFRFEHEGGLGWLYADLKWPDTGEEADNRLEEYYIWLESQPIWETVMEFTGKWNDDGYLAFSSYSEMNDFYCGLEAYEGATAAFITDEARKGYDERIVDFITRLGAVIADDTVVEIEGNDGGILKVRVVTFEETGKCDRKTLARNCPALYDDIALPEGIPDNWPLELPIPEDADVISADYDKNGNYIVDMEDSAWIEMADRYEDYFFSNLSDSYDRSNWADYPEFRKRIIMLNNLLFDGVGSIVEIRAWEGNTEDIILRFTE
ncbi:MAG: hypothetical protein IJC56_03490, partial [Clostridia bacterium]|nr:hypothetical protein [Clostridia bacterium]